MVTPSSSLPNLANPPPAHMRNTDLLAVRAFVMAQDHVDHAHLHPHIVLVDLTHSNLQQQHLEIRLDKHFTIDDLCRVFQQKTGSAVSDQVLTVYNDWNEVVVPALPLAGSPDAARPLGYFLNNAHTCRRPRIHCTDTNPASISARGALENTALVPKYIMSETEYASRPGTLRAWTKQQQAVHPHFTLHQHAVDHAAWRQAVMRHKQGQPLPAGFVVDDNSGAVVAAAAAAVPGELWLDDASSVQHVHVGDRCQIQPGGRRGRVAWVGVIPTTADATADVLPLESSSYWVGIVLDEPVGKNDGTWTKSGTRYFDAPPMYGVFCRGRNVETGDFPERDIFEDSDDDDDEL